MVTVLFISLVILFLLNVPIAFAMGIASLFALLSQDGIPLVVIPQRLFVGLDSFPLLAIPFFLLVGSIMERGGVSEKLVDLASTLVGHIRGGLGMISVVAAMFFAGISGSSAADTAAIGKITIPAMKKKGYDASFAASLQATAGAIGVIIPPSITMVIFGVVSGASIGQMFMGGIIPGILMGVALMSVCYIIAVIKKYPAEDKATFKEIFQSFFESAAALIMPLIVLGGILFGVFTATEAAIVAVLYGLILGFFVYKKLNIKNFIEVVYESALTASMVSLLIGIASLFGWIVTYQRVPQSMASLLVGVSENPSIIYFMIIVIFLVVGLFMETAASIIIMAPVLVPIADSMGIDLVHFGVVVVIALAIGMATPPVGINLFVTSSIANLKMSQMVKGLWPFLLAMFVVLLLVTYIPFLVLWLPSLVVE